MSDAESTPLQPDRPGEDHPFAVDAPFEPAGDQPDAIEELVAGYESGMTEQTLLGVTGSGKTNTVSWVVEEVDQPTLVIAHNKTLAAQLYEEFRELFPDNAVEYFATTTTSPKPTSSRPTPTSTRICRSTRRSSGCATPQRGRF